MGARYSFIAIFPMLLIALGAWSKRMDHIQLHQQGNAMEALTPKAGEAHSAARRELIETLDRIVAYEHYYRSVYGHFTQLLSRVGVSIPARVLSSFDIRVSDASSDKLLITALSEVHGKVTDLVSIDQNFEFHANFPLPAPRPEYLRLQAFKQLRALQGAPQGLVVEEQGIYRGYFRYEVRHDSRNQKIAFAVGTRPPVAGVQLEFGPSQAIAFRSENAAADFELMLDRAEASDLIPQSTGQKAEGSLRDSTEQAFLAQKIFHGEMGRYANTWSELSRIAHFRFDGLDPGASPGIPAEGVQYRRLAEVDVSELKSQEPLNKSLSPQSGLEIELIASDR